MMTKETSSWAVCKQLAEILTSKGLKAYYGNRWDGACDYKDPTFWYFHPRGKDVGAYVMYDGSSEGHTYDAGDIDPNLEAAVARVKDLGMNPSRDAVWEALG